MPEYLSNKKRKQSIGINSYSEYTDTTKIIGNVLVGFGSVGVGTTVPTQDVDVNTIRVRDTLFDYTNSGGEFGYYLVKDTDGIKWVAVPPIDSNAIFVAENNNILGVSSFTGINIISDELLGVTTNTTNPNFADITILPRWIKSGDTGIYTTKNVGIGTTIPTTDFQVGFGTTGVTIDGSIGVVSALGYYGNYAFIDRITVRDQLNVVGLGSTLVAAYLASAGGITTTGGDLYVGGTIFADKLDIINLKVVNIEATGITTLNVGIVSTFRVTGVSTLGVTSTKDLFVDANLKVSGITTLGITSTKNLYVDENLYVVGIATATRFSTGATGSAINITSNTISGPTEIIIDPADVGDNSGAVRIKGDLFVDGEEFIVNSTTIELADFNVGIASTVGTNFLLDGAGIGIGSTNIRKTLTYDYSSDSLKSSENFDLGTGKVYKINETEVLSSTQLTVANINATGVSTLGFATIGQLYVSGVSTFVGVGTFINDLYVGGDLYVADDIFFDELNAKNANITGITTLNVGIVSTFRVTGVSTLGVTTISQLYVSGVSTFVGVGTFINDLYVGEVLYADVVTGLTSTRDLLVDGNLRVTGISTLGVTSISQLYVSGITTLGVTTISQLNVSGITTLGVTSTTNLTSQQLNVSGITTLGVTSTTNLTSQQLNVSGITTLGITTAQQLYVSGVSTFVGVGTFIDDLYVGKVLYAKTVDFDNIEVENIKATGISTLNVGIVSTLTVAGVSTLGITSTTSLTSQQLNVSGITTLGITSTTNLTSQQLNVTGISTLGVTSTTNLTSQQLNVIGVTTLASIVGTSLSISGISTLGITSTTNLTTQQLNVSGITTLGVTTITQLYVSGVSTFSDRITGIISTATKLENQRTFEITGDVVASPIFFDGTGNVSLAATIQPNSVGLGTDTFGDYVKDITGTANQITVTGGTGEGSIPILSIPNQFNVPQDLIVIRDVQINRDLNVNGNITVGGTAATLFTQTFKVYDADIILGVRTDGNGNDISKDNSANHGGIAIASTEGNPLIILTNPGIGETLPATYKKIMWFKEGSFAGLGTDAWLSNYALGVGTTELQAGTVLAAGSVQFSKDDLKIVRNINASGIITATEFKGTLTGYASSAGIATNLGGGPGVVYQYTAGITSFVPNAVANDKVLIWKNNVPVWGTVDTGSLSGSIDYAVKAGVATYADNAGVSTTSGYATNAGIATYADTAGVSTTSGYATSAGVSTTSNYATSAGIATYADTAGVSTTSGYATSAGIATYADRAGISTISTNVIGGIASVTSLDVSGISTLGTIEISSGIITATTGVVTYYGDGSKLSGVSAFSVQQQDIITSPVYPTFASNIGTSSLGIAATELVYIPASGNLGIGTTTPTSKLTVVGDVLVSGVLTATRLYSGIYGEFVGGSISGSDIVGTSLSITGISTLGTVKISSGIITATTGGIVTYYGDGSNLTGVSALSVQQLDLTASPVYPTFANGVGSTSLGISSTQVAYIPSSGNLGIGTTTPTSKLTVQGDVRVSGILTAASFSGTASTTFYTSEWILGANGSNDYTFTGPGFIGNELDPTLYLIRGERYKFTNTMNAHPFRIQSTPGTSGTPYNDGIVNNGVSNGTLTWDVQFNAPNVLYYQCTAHGPMVGKIYVVDAGIGTDVSINTSGIITASHIVGTSLSITGISTIANFLMTPVGTGATVGGVGIVTYYGDGRNLTNVVGAFGGIGTAGGTVGTGITFLDFRGSGISSITVSSGIATITIPGASRSVNSYVATEGQPSFAATYSVGYADVYLNGSKLSSTEYAASNGTSIELTEGASAGDIVEIVSYLINITGGSSTPDISPVMMGMIF